MDRFRFGPAGIPNSFSGPSEGAIAFVRQLGLDAMELEFVKGIWMKEERAEIFRELSRKHDVVLTAHAPYYINLNSRKREVVEKSRTMILRSAELLHMAGGFSLVFHAGFYHGEEPKKVTERMKEEIGRIAREAEDRGVDVWIRPELMGKLSQWGDLEELLEVSAELEMVEPLIDFAHLHARHRGRYNSAEEWREVLSRYEEVLGSEALKRVHFHVSGINYGKKGEKNHLNLRESDLNYEELIEVFREFKLRGVVISESPSLEEDALLLKRLYESGKSGGNATRKERKGPHSLEKFL